MTRRWITASWTISCGLLCHALLLVACSPSSVSPDPHVPSPATRAPSDGLAREEMPSGSSPAEESPGAGVDEAVPEAEPAHPEPHSSQASAEPEGASDGAERMVEFFGIGRGDRVADLGGVFGYSLTPIRRAIGRAGVLYVRRRTPLPADPAAAGDDALGAIVWMNTPDEAPLSVEATRLNAVTLLFAYHAVVAAGHDRQKMNAAVYRALVPGGIYVIADHAAAPGAGIAAARQENRIEDRIVRSEVQAAGFEFVEAADFISNAVSSADRSPGGQYLLKFRKPR
jgi:predicted methyltransferase